MKPGRAGVSSRRVEAVVLALGGLAILVSASVIRAQRSPRASPGVERLEVALWPEYDRPEMLVILRGELPAGTPVPADLSIPIASDVPNLHAVAWEDTQGGLKLAQYDLESRDGRRYLDLSTPSRSFRVEYYGSLERNDSLRTFTFKWPGGPAVESFGYRVQVPPGATDVVASPPPSGEGLASDGLTYLRGELGEVPVGETRRIELSYRKTSDTLTAPASSSPSGEPAAPSPPMAASSDTPWWPVYVVAALLFGILIGRAFRPHR